MQTQQLRYFLEVASTLNITKAARNLYISQSSLSQQIINLEKELDLPLLVRHSKSVTLTDAGEQFAQHATRIVNGMEQLSELMNRYSMLQEGTLRIGVLFIAGYLDLYRVLALYKERHPGLNYKLTVGGSVELLNQLLNRSIHAGFIICYENRLQQHDELFYHKIVDDYYTVAVSKRNPLSKKKKLKMEDLKNEPIIMPAPSSEFRSRVEQQFSRAGVEPNILCESSQTAVVTQLIEQNLGVGFVSSSIAAKLEVPDVKFLPLENTLQRSIYYVTPKELLDYPAIHSLTEFIEQYPFAYDKSL